MNNGKKPSTPADKMTTAAVVIVILAILALGVWATHSKIADNVYRNKVESGKIPMNVSYAAEQAGQTIEEYLTPYGLQESDEVNGDTLVNDLYGYMTFENYIKMANEGNEEVPEIDQVIEDMGLKDKVTKDTKWKDVEPIIPVGKYFGEEQLNQYKQAYGITDEEVTPETTYGDFQKIVQEKAANAVSATNAPANAETTAAPAAE